MALSQTTNVSLKNQIDDIKESLKDDWLLYLMVVLKGNDQPIGYIPIDWMDDEKRFAWIRFMTGSHRKKGYTKDALTVLIKILFSQN
jgi:[ribosomal protein S5]-alanine N-acetyltransferase